MSIQPQIFVLVDALGWQYLKGKEFLSDICSYRTPVRTVLGFSSGAIPAILTGTLPQTNGHWNLFYFDPKGSPLRWLKLFNFLPDKLLDNRITRKLIKEIGRRILGLGPMFECYVPVRLLPFFNISERRNIYKPGGLNGINSIFDNLSQKRVRFGTYSYHQHSDDQILALAESDVRARKYDFYFLYLSELDAFLHEHCQDPAGVQEKLDWYALRLRRLYTAARAAYPEIHFTVFSDHGMTPSCGHYDLAASVERLDFSTPRDYLAVYDSTMARFWFSRPEVRTAITQELEAQTYGRILCREELETLGLWFDDHRYGELIFLMNPGLLIQRNNFNGQWLPVGMHGYHPDDPWSDAAYLSNEPPPVPVKTITDIYSVMMNGLD